VRKDQSAIFLVGSMSTKPLVRNKLFGTGSKIHGLKSLKRLRLGLRKRLKTVSPGELVISFSEPPFGDFDGRSTSLLS